ncbi:C69 family dipeptidase [Hutsoniella sourekii]|uniref:C69 family dipeptidase n=1 Tax=Hutsoniella sourekii TaxID=87650 RepID=UPI000483C56B|nr:C69 family dipeptidase [Hutsoniella sourekii]
MKKLLQYSLLALLGLGIVKQPVLACTGVYVGKDLTTDGTTIFGRTEDLEPDHNKNFIVVPAKTNKPGDKYKDLSNGFEFDLPRESYQYTAIPDTTPDQGDFHEAGFNEHGVAMDATVTAYPHHDILEKDPLVKNGLSESNITNVVLPHVKTAREGIELIAQLVTEKGAAEGNSLILSDKKETWYMEILSGHQYAAIKLPSDKYAVFPNGYYLGAIDIKDKENVISSPDIIKVAKEAGRLVEEKGQIKVAASYGYPIEAGTKSRYVQGVNLLDPDANLTMDSKETPLLRDAKKKISLQQVKDMMRNRFEGSEFIPADNAASPTGEPIEYEEDLPDNARYPVGNVSTMEAHIFQMDASMPDKVPGTMWLAMGSPNASPFLPYFANITDTATPYKVSGKSFDEKSYYWTVSRIFTQVLSNEKEELPKLRSFISGLEKEANQKHQDWVTKIKEGSDKNNYHANEVTQATSQLAEDQFQQLQDYMKTLQAN